MGKPKSTDTQCAIEIKQTHALCQQWPDVSQKRPPDKNTVWHTKAEPLFSKKKQFVFVL